MAKRQTVLARSKKCEREIQQYLWPGTHFAGGALRPALEQCDLRGDDADGWPLWGEAKNYDLPTVKSEGGTYAVLAAAYAQCEAAIEANRQDWPHGLVGGSGFLEQARPRPFAVLVPKGCRRDDQRLVMFAVPGWGQPVVLTLAEFKRRIVDGQPAQEVA